MPENASLNVEFQNFLAIGKDGLGSPSLGPGSSVREKGKKPVERAKKTRRVKWATHWTGKGERRRNLEKCLDTATIPSIDTRFWYHAMIGQMSQCWQICGAIDRWNTMLFQSDSCCATKLRNLLVDWFGCSSPVAHSIFSSETSIFCVCYFIQANSNIFDKSVILTHAAFCSNQGSNKTKETSLMQ